VRRSEKLESGCKDDDGLKDKHHPFILPKSFNPDSKSRISKNPIKKIHTPCKKNSSSA